MLSRNEIQIRDPFIFTCPEERNYYLFGTTDRNPWNSRGSGFDAYISRDLENFQGPFRVFSGSPDFWGTHDFWAPELHFYKNRYYLFASFTSETQRRGTQILVSDSILGPFHPLINRAVTPESWECLDGTFHVDESGNPWIVFCHEWVQVNDGAVYTAPLTEDLCALKGEPHLLFTASRAPWTRSLERRDGSGIRDARVTDGPFLHRQKDGQLVMLWSSLAEQGYAMGCALSESGDIRGPWRLNSTPLVEGDGGHGMAFRDFSGNLFITFHSPNKTPLERFMYYPAEESPDGLILSDKRSPA